MIRQIKTWMACCFFALGTLAATAQDPNGFECECEDTFDTPVCVVDELGNVFSFPSECLAECLGLSLAPEADCDLWDPTDGGDDFPWDDEGNGDFPWDDEGNDDFPIDFECDCDFDFDGEFGFVCATLENGEVCEFPNECFAECFGASVVDCDEYYGEGWDDYPWEDEDDNDFPVECDCELDPASFEWVCAVMEDGTIAEFPNECFATCFGAEVVDCDELYGEGWDDYPWEDEDDNDFPVECDCELDPAAFEWVCAVMEDGSIAEFPNECFANCFGAEVVDCEFDGGDDNNGDDDDFPFECDCELDPNSFEWVCAVMEDGSIAEFPNECFANCFGAEVVDCEFDGGDDNNGGDDDFPFECDCELDPNSFEWVCAVMEDGSIAEFPNECFANCFGAEVVDCEFDGGDDNNGGDDGDIDIDFPTDCDCDIDPNSFEWVCAELEEGIIVEFPNECIANCFGATVIDCEDNDGGDDNNGGDDFPIDFDFDFDCECDFDPSSFEWVCAELEDGTSVQVPNACFAECLGATVVDCDDSDEDNEGDFNEGFTFDTWGLEDIEMVFEYYPNPFGDDLNINLGASQSGNYNVNIVDITGKVVLKEQITLAAGTNSRLQFATSDLNTGIYVVQVTSPKGKMKTAKLIKE